MSNRYRHRPSMHEFWGWAAHSPTHARSDTSVIISPGLIVVWRQLVQELLDAMLLPNRVDVRDLVFGQRREVEVDLQRGEERRREDKWR